MKIKESTVLTIRQDVLEAAKETQSVRVAENWFSSS